MCCFCVCEVVVLIKTNYTKEHDQENVFVPDIVFKLSLPQVNVNHEGAAVSSNVYQDVQI
jgi:hypothetical protein